jgi:hypothetical protein
MPSGVAPGGVASPAIEGFLRMFGVSSRMIGRWKRAAATGAGTPALFMSIARASSSSSSSLSDVPRAGTARALFCPMSRLFIHLMRRRRL